MVAKFTYCSKTTHPSRIAVVGAGFAGLTLARVLALEGLQVEVFDAVGAPGQRGVHDAHLTAGMMPTVSSDLNFSTQLSRLGCQASEAFWQDLPSEVGWRCGAIQLPRQTSRQADFKQVVARLSALPQAKGWVPHWVRSVDADEASEIAGMALSQGGLYFPCAWSVRPRALLQALAHTDGVTVINQKVMKVIATKSDWLLEFEAGLMSDPYDVVVLANGLGAKTVLSESGLMAPQNRLQNMYGIAGEVTHLPAEKLGGGPQCMVAGEGYVLPASDGLCTVGGTYALTALSAQCEPGGVQMNVNRAAELLDQPDLPQKLSGLPLSGWAGWRAVLPNRMPVIGPVDGQKGLWLATGFGSKGLTWSVLAANQVANGVLGRPNFMPERLFMAVLPTLFK
jgi:tRNA 5-methylaminomethyl-2-thiouridine biosynthesis bifunctional protein